MDWGSGSGPDIVDDGGDATLLIHERVKVDEDTRSRLSPTGWLTIIVLHLSSLLVNSPLVSFQFPSTIATSQGINMWKLKIADGKEESWLFITNNFIGRQTWEFDENASTSEEHVQVEKAHEEFVKNRKQGYHPCGDLLMRMQVIVNINKLKYLCYTIFVVYLVLFDAQLIRESGIDVLSEPAVRLGEKEEVTYEAITRAVKKGVKLNRAIQASDGHWPAENAGPMFFTPPLWFADILSIQFQFDRER